MRPNPNTKRPSNLPHKITDQIVTQDAKMEPLSTDTVEDTVSSTEHQLGEFLKKANQQDTRRQQQSPIKQLKRAMQKYGSHNRKKTNNTPNQQGPSTKQMAEDFAEWRLGAQVTPEQTAAWMCQKYKIPTSQQGPLRQTLGTLKHLVGDTPARKKVKMSLYATAAQLAKQGKLSELARESETPHAMFSLLSAIQSGANPKQIKTLLQNPSFKELNAKNQGLLLLRCPTKAPEILSFFQSKGFAKLSLTQKNTAAYLMSVSNQFSKSDSRPGTKGFLKALLARTQSFPKQLKELHNSIKQLQNLGPNNSSDTITNKVAKQLSDSPYLFTSLDPKTQQNLMALLLVGQHESKGSSNTQTALKKAFQEMKKDNPGLAKHAVIGALTKLGVSKSQLKNNIKKELSKTFANKFAEIFQKASSKYINGGGSGHVVGVVGTVVGEILFAPEGSNTSDKIKNAGMALLEYGIGAITGAAAGPSLLATLTVELFDSYAKNDRTQRVLQSSLKFLQQAGIPTS